MEITPQIADELRAWVRIAEEQLRQDRGATKAQIEQDRINRMACDRAEVLCCRRMLTELEALPQETEAALRHGPVPVMGDGTLADPEKYGVISIDTT